MDGYKINIVEKEFVGEDGNKVRYKVPHVKFDDGYEMDLKFPKGGAREFEWHLYNSRTSEKLK